MAGFKLECLAGFVGIRSARGLAEAQKEEGYEKFAGRVMLFNEVIKRGLMALHDETMK